jgi:hypothetical protein
MRSEKASAGRKAKPKFRSLRSFQIETDAGYQELVFAISNETQFSGHTLNAIASAVTEKHPFRALRIG